MLAVRKEQITEEWKRWNHKRLKALWADPVYRAKQMKSRANSRKYKNKNKKIAIKQKARYASGELVIWNKGLTKETHKSVKKCSDKLIGRIPNRQSEYLIYQRGKKIIHMRSWWEVAYAEYLDLQKIKWTYEPRYFNVGSSKKWKGVSYTPDFFLVKEKKYIEIKGLEPKQFKAKFRRFKKRYPKVKIELIKGKALKDLDVLDIHGVAVLSKQGVKNRKKHRRKMVKY
jgi:hypothetical protein